MKRKYNDNRVDEMLARHLHREPAEFDFEQWAEKFPEEARLAAAGFAPPATNRRVQFAQIWRCIMTSRYTRYASVAAVLLVAFSFLFPGRNGIVPESIVWADVQKALTEMETGRATGMRNCFLGDEETPTYALPVEKSFSVHYGYADRTYNAKGEVVIYFTYHLPSGTITILFPTYKRYYRMQVPASNRDEAKQVTPESFFTTLFASGDYRKLGPKEIKGAQAVGFEVSDLAERFLGKLGINQALAGYFLAHGPEDNTRLWADPKTRLPVLVEFDGQVDPCLLTGYRKMRLTEIDDVWEFNVDFDESLFSPEIPDDYQPLVVPAGAKVGAALSVTGLACVPYILIAKRRRARKRQTRCRSTVRLTVTRGNPERFD
jgi:hypothetical protein